MDVGARNICSSDSYLDILENNDGKTSLRVFRNYLILAIATLAIGILSYFAGTMYADRSNHRELSISNKAAQIHSTAEKQATLSHAVSVKPSVAPTPVVPVAIITRDVLPDSYVYGQCTYYVAKRRNIPANWGNANTWYARARNAGFSEGLIPRPGAIAWTSAGYYGHVAYVESVGPNDIIISEMNFNGNWNRVTYRAAPASAFRYIY